MALGQQLNDREDAHVFAFAAPAARHARRVAPTGLRGRVGRDVCCPQNSSSASSRTSVSLDARPALAKIAVGMDRERRRARRAPNLSTLGHPVDESRRGSPSRPRGLARALFCSATEAPVASSSPLVYASSHIASLSARLELHHGTLGIIGRSVAVRKSLRNSTPSARHLIDGVCSIPHREPAVAVGAVASALRVGRVAGRGQVFCHRLRVVGGEVDGEMVQTAFRGIDLRLGRVGGKALAAGVQFSAATAVASLAPCSDLTRRRYRSSEPWRPTARPR